MLNIPSVGRVVGVRQRRYLVEDVVPPPSARDATLVRLACLDDDAQGQSLEVLWELEPDAQLLTSAGWDHLADRGFDPPKFFSAYLHTLRWNTVTATNPRLFQSPFRAGIKLDAYQLEPLRKALLLPRVNLFIADDVGLGKTIEAGLIARELLMRKKVRSIVVAAPPSIVPQWQDELEQRFGMQFQVIDREFLLRIRRERGYANNPWETHSRFLISHRLLIDDQYTTPLRDWLGTFRPGTLLILDEAHHAAPAAGSRYAVDSQITRAVADLAPRFEHRLFLSATPHNGHSNSFSALLEILDPQRFGRFPVNPKNLQAIMVRRIKEDIRAIQGGFPKRSVEAVVLDDLPADTPELLLSSLLDRYRTHLESRLSSASKRKQALGMLLLSGLQQRLLSSVEAFARTLRVHRRTVERREPVDRMMKQTNLLNFAPGADDEPNEHLDTDVEAQVEAATATLDAAHADGLKLLDEMLAIAEAARNQRDARVRFLLDWVRKNLMTGSTWNRRRVIIFTEWDDTLRYLREQLTDAFDDNGRIAVYRGTTSTADRKAIKAAFNADPDKHPLRILLCTDAAREGINLQSHCADLFHFDVPWNPSRLEQRNGRIDRKLQPASEVFCRYFIYAQRAEDRVLKALVRKTKVIQQELGSLSKVIESRISERLADGIRHAEADALAERIEREDLDAAHKTAVAEELDAARIRQDDIRENLEELRGLMKTSRDWVGLDEEDRHFQAAISCGLELLQSTPLSPTAEGRFAFPALDERAGGDASWADTLDALREPRKPDQTHWQWRREAKLRPVVFKAADTMTDEVVQLHLEHRVVQRLLGRFTSQGFVYHDLSRACLAQTADPIPRVALIGRLCLYGDGAARLHEVLIEVTARWVEPKLRKGKLKPFTAAEQQETLQLLHDALLKPAQPQAEVVLQQLQSSAPGDVADLLPELEKRGEQLAEQAVKALTQRGAKEADDMRKILEDQRKRIQKAIHDFTPGLFDDHPDEKRQMEADHRHRQRRLGQLDTELQSEPERIIRGYEVKARRIEPVGLVYLWPTSG